MNQKDKIRRIIKEGRNTLTEESKKIKDDKIFNKIINSEYYKKSNVIFLYVSFQGEVDTHKLIKHSLNIGKVICVPKVISKKEGMEAIKINSFNELKNGKYDILEPKDICNKIYINDIELILMPGVAFDENGGRIGYGGGFYDRFLNKIDSRIPKIALAYDFQVFENIPCEEHDIKVDGIITDL
ncbi:5-formyltetrahydrofolate cyclo-ligase [Clostridium massiliodielmoense]|uniref:5-formyltetrahydrofolate cyclo-ligase n=1 Tax=Clostridium massiliodielmoense TaxID=1776385 RepID=UPI0004D704A6|nr:5-formyltetrahydrofolate cyclo-ligase [Clostridium massiliodielmoense]KEH97840.1 5-formyltetrahydrofolate cyclo-ligase [Clostridium botulinum C/D str. BKT12695]